LASICFLILNLEGVTYLFALPRIREGEFGGVLTISPVEALLPPGAPPVNYPRVKVGLSNTDRGITALYKVCTQLGCLYNWNTQEDKFICPFHGSEFENDGTYIVGPAPRSLDRFVVRLLDAQGNEVASTDSNGNPLPLPSEDLQVIVDTGQLIRGQPRGVSYPVT
jgi:cytochrome b6-f complex iron-sulfur subunit